jgi:hypothetical protein
MSSALEAAGADAPKRQKRPGTGIVASLGREILLQARALDKASGVKFGVEDARSGPRTWITKVQQTASVSVYTVNVKRTLYNHQLPLGRPSVITATFKDLSNAIESFMTAANPDDCQRDVPIMAFKVWEERIQVMKLTCGSPKLGSISDGLRVQLEKSKAGQIARLIKLLDDSVSITAAAAPTS